MRRRGSIALISILLAFPVALTLYTTFGKARPYHVLQSDVESDYYYNARLIATGTPPRGTHHPGTPTYYLAGGLLRLVGTDPARAQRFFDAGYLLVAALTAGAAAYFLRASRRRSLGFVALGLAAVLAWPSSMTHLNYFGADAFALPAGLAMVTLAWTLLSGDGPVPWRRLAACGLAMGACMAVKFTLVTTVGALAAAMLVHEWLAAEARRARAVARAGLVTAGGLVAGFVALESPILGQLPGSLPTMLAYTRQRAPTVDGWSRFLPSLRTLLRSSPAVDAALLVGLPLLGLIVLGALRRSRGGARMASPAGAAQAAFLGLSLLVLAYDLGAALPGDVDAGLVLRNALPAALALPFLLLFVAERLPSGLRSRAKALDAVLGIVAVAALAASSAVYLGNRADFIRDHRAVAARVQALLQPRFTGGGPIAFWDGSPGDALGPPSFHFWGNYRYAEDRFGPDLTSIYPRLTFFRLRRVSAIDPLSGAFARARPRPAPSGGTLPSRVWGAVRRALPFGIGRGRSEIFGDRSNELWEGEADGLRPSAVAFPTSETPEMGPGGLERLTAIIRHRYGQPTVTRMTLDGSDWTVVELPLS